MNKISFFQGVGLAFALSLMASIAFFIFAPLLGSYTVLRIVIASLSILYITYLLKVSKVRAGRVVVLSTWLVMAGASWLFLPSLSSYGLSHVVLIWLVRSFYLHESVLAALFDLGLALTGVVVAVSASLQSGSVFLTFWCFFLVQALFYFIPTCWEQKENKHVVEADRFQDAYRNAESALRRISTM